MSRTVYHAGKPGFPLCGSRGTMGGYHAVTLSANDWNALAECNRCAKCVAAIRAAKERKALRLAR